MDGVSAQGTHGTVWPVHLRRRWQCERSLDRTFFVLSTGHIKIETGDGFSTLTITGIETDEAGKYRIEVENQAGSASTEFEVLVKCESNFGFILHDGSETSR